MQGKQGRYYSPHLPNGERQTEDPNREMQTEGPNGERQTEGPQRGEAEGPQRGEAEDLLSRTLENESIEK